MKGLIVIDMQNDFIDGSLGSKEAQAIVENVVDKINQFDGDYICFTHDTHFDDYFDTQEGKILPISHCLKGSRGWKIHLSIVDAMNRNHFTEYKFFEKPTFGSTQLAKFLKDGRFDELIIVGLCTDVCVISNAMLIKAFSPETKIIVDAKCCAGTSVENHQNALKAMKACQIYIENWEEG